jgi:beta-glucosidase
MKPEEVSRMNLSAIAPWSVKCALLMLLVFVGCSRNDGAAGASAPPATAAHEYPFMDPSLSVEERARDLVSRMTLEEKAAQMYDKAPAIERLGVKPFYWWNEALHGVARAGEATVFPQAIGLAATWDEDLMHRVASVISDEARAKHHQFARDDTIAQYTGLTFWSPNINIFRDPRWGRGQETYGEDPYLTGRMAVNFVNGLQGSDDDFLKTVATVKHYAVHSGPEPSRHSDNYEPSEGDLRETYLAAFDMAIAETDVASVMCAYNAVWGAPACGSERLMVELLRGDLGFDGYVVSDCGAIGDFYYDEAHDYVETRAEAAALAVRMGTDLNCGDGQGNKFDALPEAVAKGFVDEATVDRAVERLFTARFRLGEFDDPGTVPFTDTPFDIVASDEHLALSEEAARASLVLLKNNGVLPLTRDAKVAVIGPNADNWMTLVANYYGIPTDPVTALAGVRAKAGRENAAHAVGSALAGDVYTHYSIIGAENLYHESEAGELVPGLEASYYPEPELKGDVAKTRVDRAIDFYWKRSPVDDATLNDYFSVRWSGILVPEKSGSYRLKTTRWMTATLNGKDVLNREFELEAGTAYPLEVTLSLDEMWYRNTIEPEARLSWVATGVDLEADALRAAEFADVILFFGGIDADLEGEEMDVEIDGFLGGDRTHLNLPAAQQSLLEKLHATGKPVVLVNFSGSAMALNWADENLAAIVQAFYPGEKAGTAIADLLWGEYSPSGRLPVTFYTSLEGLPPFDDYSMKNRTYKYHEPDPLYAFGHGLSYTNFEYSGLSLPEEPVPDAVVPVSATVTNTGERAGREVVQVYVTRQERANPSVPRVELVAFDVIELAPGASETVNFDIDRKRLGYYDKDGELVLPEGESVGLSIGGGQPGQVAEGAAVSGELVL